MDKLSTISSVDGEHNVTIEVVTVLSSESIAVFRTELELLVAKDPDIRTRHTIWLVDGDEARISAIRSVIGPNASIHLCVHHLADNFVKHTSGVRKAEKAVALGVPIAAMDRPTLLYELRRLNVKQCLSKADVPSLRDMLQQATKAAETPSTCHTTPRHSRRNDDDDDDDDDQDESAPMETCKLNLHEPT